MSPREQNLPVKNHRWRPIPSLFLRQLFWPRIALGLELMGMVNKSVIPGPEEREGSCRTRQGVNTAGGHPRAWGGHRRQEGQICYFLSHVVWGTLPRRTGAGVGGRASKSPSRIPPCLWPARLGYSALARSVWPLRWGFLHLDHSPPQGRARHA